MSFMNKDNQTISLWRALAESARELVSGDFATEQAAGQRFDTAMDAVQNAENLPEMPRIVCLCGSTRQKAEFLETQREETWAGRIVLSVGSFAHADNGGDAEVVFPPGVKEKLDELHKRKIDLADEVLVIQGFNGYCGPSTLSEIKYALRTSKQIRLKYPERGINGMTGDKAFLKLTEPEPA